MAQLKVLRLSVLPMKDRNFNRIQFLLFNLLIGLLMLFNGSGAHNLQRLLSTKLLLVSQPAITDSSKELNNSKSTEIRDEINLTIRLFIIIILRCLLNWCLKPLRNHGTHIYNYHSIELFNTVYSPSNVTMKTKRKSIKEFYGKNSKVFSLLLFPSLPRRLNIALLNL